MAALPSQTSTLLTAFPILIGTANYALFRTELSEYLNSNFGEVGQHVILGTKAALSPPGKQPDYFDLRLHPRTKVPIPNDRKYPVKEITEDQMNDRHFDAETLEMTATAAKIYADDTAAWTKATATYADRLLSLRTLDDALYNFLLTHIDRGTLEVIKAHSDHIAFRALPATCVDRGHRYLKIIDKQYSLGNSTVSITEMTKFLALTQGPIEEESTASFVNKVMDHYARIAPFFTQCATVDEVKELLVTMVLIKGLNKHHRPTLRALEIFTQAHKNMDAFRNFTTLRQEVLSAQDSDLSNLKDPVSEHSSAFTAALTPPNLVAQAAAVATKLPSTAASTPTNYGLLPNRSGKPSCPYCLLHLKRHYTHLEADCFNKKNGFRTLPPTSHARSKPKTATPSSDIHAQLHARLAAVEAATATPTNNLAPVERSFSTQELNAMLAQHGLQYSYEPHTTATGN